MQNCFRIHKIYILLFFIFILAFVVRIFLLHQNFFFGFEQGRDMQVTQDIIHLRKFTLIGPKTDIAGIFHGVWYYYLLSVFNLIGSGSPFVALSLLVILNSLTVIVIFFTTLEITSNNRISLLSSLLFAMSFNAIIYARWLSNVSPSIFFSALFFYFLIKYIKKESNKYWILLITIYGFLFHFELLDGLYGGVLLLLLFIFVKFKLTLTKVATGMSIFTLINLPFIIFDVRHNGVLIKSVLGYLLKADHKETNGNIYVYVSGLYEEITRTLFPSSRFILLFFLLFIVGGFIYFYYHHRKKVDVKILVTLVFSIVWSFPYIFLIKEYPLEQFYAGTLTPIIIGVCYLIHNNSLLVKKTLLVVIPVCLLFNTLYIYKSLSTTTNIFYHSVQKTLHYKDQTDVMDYIFSYSHEEFHYAAFTNPYYMQDSWHYLYNWYGNLKYKNMIEKNKENKGKKYVFLIIEPSTEGIYLNKWLESFEKESTIISINKFGPIKVIIRKNIVN